MKEVLTVHVRITDIQKVDGGESTVQMIAFEGGSDCENFKGRILPGGVDTQKITPDGECVLSARYMLEGVDREGHSCKVFIENNGKTRTGEDIITSPVIRTDSKALSYLETADLYGTIEPCEGGVIIHIFEK